MIYYTKYWRGEITTAKSLIKNLQRKQARQAADEAAKQLVLDRWEQFCTKADIAILYTLWNDFGFGKARLERFYRSWIRNQYDMISRFRSDGDDGSYWVMQKRLEEATGIDLAALQAEIDEADAISADGETGGKREA